MEKSIYTEPHLKLCAWLKARRLEKNLKVRELATLLDVHHSKIVCVERGRRRLDVVQFVKWCVALGANPQEIVDQLWRLECHGSTVPKPTWTTNKDAAEAAVPVRYTTRRKARG